MSDSSVRRTLVSHVEAVAGLFAALSLLVFANLGRMNSINEFLLMRITLAHAALGVLFLAAWEPCFRSLERKRSAGVSVVGRFGRVLRGATVMALFFALLLITARVHTPVFPVTAYFWLVCLSLVSVRLLSIWCMQHAPWRLRTQILILGTGPMARRAWREIRTKQHHAATVVGFVDRDGPQQTCPEIAQHYLGDVAALEDILLKNVVDTMVIAMPAKACYEAIEQAVAISERVGVDVVFSDVFGDVFGGIFPGSGWGASALQLETHSSTYEQISRFVKRCLDVVAAACALLVLSPVFLIISVLIKTADGGPAFFVQERYGYRRRKFKLYKFRTMTADADDRLGALEQQNEAVGPIFKMRNDPRITPLGRWLRRISLDELPQLWNVLQGSMSLVGPRPMSVRDVSLFSSSYLMRRFRVIPGMTGLWQVSGRSELPFDQWIAMDFRYIDNWSLTLDFSILLRTIPAVLKGSGAM
jgi:exopolysaccharide biosynthesis polyprenyl glycosylphosphotransferase